MRGDVARPGLFPPWLESGVGKDGQIPDDTYHAMASTRNARLIGPHLAWIIWVLVDVGSNEDLMRGESPRRAEGDRKQYERVNIITFDVFVTERKQADQVDKKDAELFDNGAEEKEVLPPPQINLARWFGTPTPDIAQGIDSRPPPGRSRPNQRSESDLWRATQKARRSCARWFN